MNNIRFSHTVSTKQFNKKVSSLLWEQTDNLSLQNQIVQLQTFLENEDYELFLPHLARLKENVELYLMFLNDTEENVSSYLNLQQKQEDVVEPQPKETEVIQSTQPSKDPMEQLQQIEKLVSVVKSLKGEQT
jgi:hypothetical protein